MADAPIEPDELSVDELDAVAGGKDSQPAPKPPPKKDQHEFLTIVLTDVLIIS